MYIYGVRLFLQSVLHRTPQAMLHVYEELCDNTPKLTKF